MELKVKKTIMLYCVSAIGIAGFAPATFAMTEAQCEAAWKSADTNNDGYVTEVEAARYYSAARVANKPVGERLAKADFLNHCKAGLFDVREIDKGAPLKGANSFTESQARDRAMAHGLTDVAGLKKDADGIWRGTAKHDGKAVTVAVDYKGNVVAN